jgi:hypothetical protein
MTKLQQQILKAGLGDWVPLRAIYGLSSQVGFENEDGIKAGALSAISQLAAAGLIEIGEVSDGGFFGWSSSVAESISRIKNFLDMADRDRWGFAAWIRNTPKGDSEAQNEGQ